MESNQDYTKAPDPVGGMAKAWGMTRKEVEAEFPELKSLGEQYKRAHGLYHKREAGQISTGIAREEVEKPKPTPKKHL